MTCKKTEKFQFVFQQILHLITVNLFLYVGFHDVIFIVLFLRGVFFMSKYWFSNADTYAKVAELGDVIQCSPNFIYHESENDLLEHLTPEREYDEENEYYYDIFQFFFINKDLADLLLRYSDEIIFFDKGTECYIWGVTHFGTAWSIVPFSWKD